MEVVPIFLAATHNKIATPTDMKSCKVLGLFFPPRQNPLLRQLFQCSYCT